MPSADAATVTMRVEEIGETTGLWCDHCLLPSVTAIELVLVVNGWPDSTWTARACMDCDWQDLGLAG